MLGRVSDKDLRLLRVFITVVESGGFSLATARLNVAESTISTHMTDLETRLGIRLCERGRGGFRVTQRGQEVYQETLALFDRMDEFRERLALVKTHMGGTLRIGMPDGMISHDSLFISDWLSHVSDQKPDMSIEIIQDTPRVLERLLVDEKIHCAISARHRSVAGLEFLVLTEERNQFYCGRTHPHFLIPDQDISIEMIEAGGPIARGYIDRFDEEFFNPDSHRTVVHHIESAGMLILSGRHAGFLPVHYAKRYVDNGQIRALKPDEIFIDVPLGIVFKKGREQNPLIASILKDAKAGLLTTPPSQL
jgi:LysR family transcriptional regulator, transcriptional activator for bauABCD operon